VSPRGFHDAHGRSSLPPGGTATQKGHHTASLSLKNSSFLSKSPISKLVQEGCLGLSSGKE